MYKVQVKNSRNQTLTLTQRESQWQIVSITGLNPPPVELHNSIIAGVDGARTNYVYMNTRQIVILLALKGNIEANRQTLYSYFKTKENLTFYFRNQRRNVRIDGTVTTCEVDLFEFAEAMQITIICQQPLFIGTRYIQVFDKSDRSLFHFPFAIDEAGVPLGEIAYYRQVTFNYAGEAPTGAIIRLTALGNVVNPYIVNRSSGEGFYFKDLTLAIDDTITINTESGSREATGVIDHVDYSLFNNIDLDRTKWIQIAVGNNEFYIYADEGGDDLSAEIEYSVKYEGV